MSDLLLINPLSGDIKPAWAYEAADKLLRKIRSAGLWGTLDFYFEIWLKKNPSYSNKYNEAMKDLRGSRRNESATFSNKSNRMLVSVPAEFSLLVDKFFSDEVKEMGSQVFWRKFAKRYPIFKVPTNSV